MAKIKKKSTRTIMSPEEEIRSITHSVSDYYEAYRQQANAVMALIVLAVVVALGYSFVKSGNEKKAGLLLSEAYDAYAPGGGAPANYPAALQKFQEVVKQYGNTTTGAIAAFSIGNTYAAMGQADAALKEYEAFTKKYSGEKLLLGVVYQRIGYLHMNAGRRDDAIKAFGQAESLSGTGVATVELARLYDQVGNMPESLKKYKAISTDLPATAWASEARTKLPPPSLGQPVKPEQPAAAAK